MAGDGAETVPTSYGMVFRGDDEDGKTQKGVSTSHTLWSRNSRVRATHRANGVEDYYEGYPSRDDGST